MFWFADVLETGKIETEIEVPGPEGEGTYKYDLYAIACHLGALGGGHYICYARNPNNKWYRYNDSSTKVSFKSFLLISNVHFTRFANSVYSAI